MRFILDSESRTPSYKDGHRSRNSGREIVLELGNPKREPPETHSSRHVKLSQTAVTF